MSNKEYELDSKNTNEGHKSSKFNWYWSPVYCAFWFVLYYIAVIPSFYSYPETNLIRNERQLRDEFIGERAQIQLLGLSSIGVKLTGTVENEELAVQFLLNEINKIEAASRKDLYDIEVELQYSSGDFMLWGMATSYHNVSNVIVKIAPKYSQSESYLLVNSHFDSEVGSPAAADAGVMIVVMLETLRVISISQKELKNPIVFLLNGAEESNLLAAHGFITQHRWAEKCKALINLDSTGSGGREVLFQTGPNHPWLIKYYAQAAKHPFASTVAEELFQNNFIPSDTDFRIFRDHRGVPGLDMAHALNGYVYHTKYDNFQTLERGTYQTTGDNVLALTWALANAPELTNPEQYEKGHAIFYDYLGWFMISYTETTGIVINSITSAAALILISVMVFVKAKKSEQQKPMSAIVSFLLIVLIQLLTVLAAVGLTLLMGVIVDALGLSQAWYSHQWLIFGLYYCPMFFAMTMLPALYIHFFMRKKPHYSVNETITYFMHAHCIILSLICIILTSMGIRSSFFCMIAVFFYVISMILEFVISFCSKKSYLLPVNIICQIMPFWFYTYMAYTFLTVFIPMQGRDGPTSKPEILISGFVALTSIHFGGFILPVLHKFRKSKTICSIFGVLAIIFVIIAATPAGFPYKKDVSAQRFYVLHTERTIRDYNGHITKNDNGFYIQPVDTRPDSLSDTTFAKALPLSWTTEQCNAEVYCGLPLYSSRWMDWKNSTKWIPAEKPNLIIPTELQLTTKIYLTNTTLKYAFKLKSADRVVIYIDPLPKVKVTNWSFNLAPLKEHHATPYFMYHVYSYDDTPLEFWLEVERDSTILEGPSFRLGIGAHFLYHAHTYTEEFKKFLGTFPDWTYTTNWVASYDGYEF